MVVLIDQGIMKWPEWQSDYPIMLATDILVIISGSLLWRMELANRAESLKMIWQKARNREESLNRAEARWWTTTVSPSATRSTRHTSRAPARLVNSKRCFASPASHHKTHDRMHKPRVYLPSVVKSGATSQVGGKPINE